MFIASSRYLVPLDEVELVRPAHLEFMGRLAAAGRIVTAGRRNPPEGGVIILRAANRADAEATMADDPYVKNGTAEYTITEFSAVMGDVRD